MNVSLRNIAAACARLGKVDAVNAGLAWPPGAAAATMTRRGCKFPIGDPKSPDFRFCNEMRLVGSPYCAGHTTLCEKQEGFSR